MSKRLLRTSIGGFVPATWKRKTKLDGKVKGDAGLWQCTNELRERERERERIASNRVVFAICEGPKRLRKDYFILIRHLHSWVSQIWYDLKMAWKWEIDWCECATLKMWVYEHKRKGECVYVTMATHPGKTSVAMPFSNTCDKCSVSDSHLQTSHTSIDFSRTLKHLAHRIPVVIWWGVLKAKERREERKSERSAIRLISSKKIFIYLCYYYYYL